MYKLGDTFLVPDRWYSGAEVSLLLDGACAETARVERQRVANKIRKEVAQINALYEAHQEAYAAFERELLFIFTATTAGTLANNEPVISKMLSQRGGELAKRFHDFQEAGRRYGGEEMEEIVPVVALIVEAVKSAGAGDCTAIKHLNQEYGNNTLAAIIERHRVSKSGRKRTDGDWLTIEFEKLMTDGLTADDAIDELKLYLAGKKPPLTKEEENAQRWLARQKNPVKALEKRIERKKKRQN